MPILVPTMMLRMRSDTHISSSVGAKITRLSDCQSQTHIIDYRKTINHVFALTARRRHTEFNNFSRNVSGGRWCLVCVMRAVVCVCVRHTIRYSMLGAHHKNDISSFRLSRTQYTAQCAHIAHRTKDNKREHLILILGPLAVDAVPDSFLVGGIAVAATVSVL